MLEGEKPLLIGDAAIVASHLASQIVGSPDRSSVVNAYKRLKSAGDVGEIALSEETRLVRGGTVGQYADVVILFETQIRQHLRFGD